MKKAKITAVILMTGLLLYGCKGGSSTFPPEQSAIYVNRSGEIYTALVGTYDTSKNYYDSTEFKAMAEKEAADYNAEHSTGQENSLKPVSLTECTLENGRAKVVYQFLTGDDLCRFTEGTQDKANHVEHLSISTVAEGLD